MSHDSVYTIWNFRGYVIVVSDDDGTAAVYDVFVTRSRRAVEARRLPLLHEARYLIDAKAWIDGALGRK